MQCFKFNKYGRRNFSNIFHPRVLVQMRSGINNEINPLLPLDSIQFETSMFKSISRISTQKYSQNYISLCFCIWKMLTVITFTQTINTVSHHCQFQGLLKSSSLSLQAWTQTDKIIQNCGPATQLEERLERFKSYIDVVIIYPTQGTLKN